MSTKMTKCKACGAEIAKSAKSCPKCGAKNKKFPVWITVILVILVLGIIGGAMGESDDKPKKSNSGNTPSSSQDGGASKDADSSKTETDRFGVGESAELNDIVVTLVGVTESEGGDFNSPEDGNIFLLCDFNIENNSSEDIAVSSIMCFSAYVDDYATSMSLSAQLASENEQLDGTVAAGKKMKGGLSQTFGVINSLSSLQANSDGLAFVVPGGGQLW